MSSSDCTRHSESEKMSHFREAIQFSTDAPLCCICSFDHTAAPPVELWYRSPYGHLHISYVQRLLSIISQTRQSSPLPVTLSPRQLSLAGGGRTALAPRFPVLQGCLPDPRCNNESEIENRKSIDNNACIYLPYIAFEASWPVSVPPLHLFAQVKNQGAFSCEIKQTSRMAASRFQSGANGDNPRLIIANTVQEHCFVPVH